MINQLILEYEDIVKVCHTEGMHLKLYSDIQNSETVLLIRILIEHMAICRTFHRQPLPNA